MTVSRLKFKLASAQVQPSTTVPEVDPHGRIPCGRFDEQQVQPGPRDRVQRLAVVFPVPLESERAVAAVDHPATHEDARLHDLIREAELTERVQATDGQRE